jgi:large subunit ribosomal protein L4
MKVTLYDQTGKKKGDITLKDSVFAVEASEGLIHEYLLYQRTNARQSIAHVKNRSDVSGGGKKPFAQKGTGRARQGSTRNPHMRGGGRAFGPKKWRNFSKQMPKKMRKKALLGLLGSKVADGKVLALDKFESAAPKTKDFAQFLAKLPLERNVLVVVNRDETALLKSSANVENAKTILSTYLNPADLTKYKHILFTEAAIKDLETTYA